jgi:hypothetical protein
MVQPSLSWLSNGRFSIWDILKHRFHQLHLYHYFSWVGSFTVRQSRTEHAIRSRVRLKPDGTRWRTVGEVKGKLANGVGSQYSHTTSELGVSSITNADAHPSAASSRLHWRPLRFKWTRPFRWKTKSGFCVCHHVSNAVCQQVTDLMAVGGRNEIQKELNVVLLKRLAELCSASI